MTLNFKGKMQKKKHTAFSFELKIKEKKKMGHSFFKQKGSTSKKMNIYCFCQWTFKKKTILKFLPTK